jgi:hypothetical protein
MEFERSDREEIRRRGSLSGFEGEVEVCRKEGEKMRDIAGSDEL